MASESAILRGKLFDRFVAQPGHQDITHGCYFLCPLCWRSFDRSATGGDNPQLTLAHIIPESLGGTWTTLSCACCNNGHGHTIETDLLMSHRVSDWAVGRGSINVCMGNEKLRAMSYRDRETNGLTFRVTTHPRNPAVAAHKKHLETFRNNPGQTTHFTIPWFRPNSCWSAICQSAYLLLFRYFGYDFARHPSYSLLRQQILHPEDRIWHGNIHVVGQEEAEKLLDGQQAAVIFTRGIVKAILAVLRFRSPGGATQALSVMINGPGEPLHAREEKVTFTPAVVPYEPEFMGTRQGFFSWRWRNWIQDGE